MKFIIKNNISKKLFIGLFLVQYLFFATGTSVLATCFSAVSPCSQKFECECCHSEQHSHSKSTDNISSSRVLLNLLSNSTECPCSVRTSLPKNFTLQLTPNNFNTFFEAEKIYAVQSSIAESYLFRDIDYYKTRPKPYIVPNNNLKILKTVILLN